VLHGIAHLLEGGTVTIRAEKEHSMLVVRVTNPCDPDRPRQKHSGFGLSLVRQRLQSQFGLAGQLDIDERRANSPRKSACHLSRRGGECECQRLSHSPS